jgi:hypothetical protein
MPSVEEARDLYERNRPVAAKRMIDDILESDPYNVPALRFALEITKNDEERQIIRDALAEARNPQAHRSRRTISYRGRVITSVILSLMGFGAIGFIIAAVARQDAKRDRAHGYITEYAEHLDVILLVNAILGLAGIALAAMLLIRGTLF